MKGYQPKLDYIPTCDVPKFLRLLEIVASHTGSMKEALRLTSVNAGTLHAMQATGRLTTAQAARIVRGYKAWKAKQEVAA